MTAQETRTQINTVQKSHELAYTIRLSPDDLYDIIGAFMDREMGRDKRLMRSDKKHDMPFALRYDKKGHRTFYRNACVFDAAGSEVWHGDVFLNDDLCAPNNDALSLVRVSGSLGITLYLTVEHFRTDESWGSWSPRRQDISAIKSDSDTIEFSSGKMVRMGDGTAKAPEVSND